MTQWAFAKDILPTEEQTAVARHSMLIVDARRERIGRLGQRPGHFQHGRGLGARQPIPYRRTEGKIGSKVNDKQVDQHQGDQRDEVGARDWLVGYPFAALKSRSGQYGKGEGKEQ